MKKSPQTAVFVALFCISCGLSGLLAQIPAQSENSAPSRSSRRSSVSLAQIPTLPSVPGANPNAAPPSFPKLPSTSVPSATSPANNNQLPRAKPPRGGFGRAGSPPSANATIPNSAAPTPTQLPAARPAPIGQPKVPNSSALQPPPPPPPPVDNPAAATSDDGSEPMIGVQFPQAPLPDILLWYEEQTGKKIVRDINVEQVTISIDTTGQMPKSKAIEYVERSLLLNGYAFVPVDDITVKFINVGAIKPSAEMTPDNIFTDVSKLPKDERIVTFIQPLQFIDAEDLRKSLTELIPQAHPYNIISPLPNSRGVIITENSNTIRYMLELLTHLDVEPSRTDQRSFQLERSDAEEVAKALSDILDLEGKGKSGSGSGTKTGYTPPTQPNAGQPGQPAGIPNQPGAAHAATPAVYGAAPQATAIPPKIIPIKRKNSLLVIARPIDLTMIEKLIEELDSAAVLRTFTNRKLVYLHALDVLPIIQDAITRGMDEGTGGSGGPGTSQPGNLTSPSSNSTTSNNSNRSSPFGNNNSSYGGGGMGGGAGGGGGGSFGGGQGSGGISALREKSTPKSMVVGKTFLIADPVANVIFASGPPEQLRVLNELFDEIDKRPQSVVINVVLGQLLLSDNRDVGIDYLFRPHQLGKNGSIAGTAGTRVGSNSTFLDSGSITPDKLLSGSGIGSGLALFGTLSDQVSVAMSALSTNSDFKILSRPILHTLNNMPATITSGVQIPIPTAGYGGGYGGYTGVADGGVNSGNINNSGGYSSGGVAYQSVDLQLEVTPHINGDDELTLEVRQQNANEGGSTKVNGNDISKITHQNLDTTVMVKNMSTVVLGGLIDEKATKERSGIPILRHIPIIKYLASSMKDTKERSELLIFIQPRIITGDGDLPPSYMDGAGSTALGAEARRFLNQEKSDPDPDKQVIHRSKIGQLIHKLFE